MGTLVGSSEPKAADLDLVRRPVAAIPFSSLSLVGARPLRVAARLYRALDTLAAVDQGPDGPIGLSVDILYSQEA